MDKLRGDENMEGQVVELTEAEQAQHQLQMEQQLKSFWAKQLVEVGPIARFKRRKPLCRIEQRGMTDPIDVAERHDRWSSSKWAVNRVRLNYGFKMGPTRAWS